MAPAASGASSAAREPLQSTARADGCLRHVGTILVALVCGRRQSDGCRAVGAMNGASAAPAPAATAGSAAPSAAADDAPMGAEELARLLGNNAPRKAASTEPRSAAAAATAAAAAAAYAAAAEESPGSNPRGEELLQTLERHDHGAAERAVRAADIRTVNYTDECNRNALFIAVAEGHVEACKLLLAREDFGGVNARNPVGATVLHIAAANDETEVCRAILECPRFEHGINAETKAGQTPLDFYTEFGEGDPEMMQLLSTAGGLANGRSVRRSSRIIAPGSLEAEGLRPAAAAMAMAMERIDEDENTDGRDVVTDMAELD
eukprot:TRINITY_DN4508_c2_g1_i1.p1 TRINITY_DN4508_c2_g1~~TRINITY_DN4508_c2_g1_i1.p1  ORF type:complete len:335 (-),score=99.44 TRINITY_DN4508_c2_g1_i1:113-1072(-)